MKEKYQKVSKSSKKGKEKEAEPKEIELTPKQLKEKRRQEAQARAAETRKIVTAGIGQWTGKLPAQLLNEHAQKMKWERVEYPVKSFGKEPNQQWVASVILSRRNPKTNEIERVRFDPPAENFPKQATQVEARNMAATYGMHRVLSHRNMKMMLPPLHRDIWIQLDTEKASAKEHESYKWSEDPWQAKKDHELARQKFDIERKERADRREQNNIAMEAHREAVHESENQTLSRPKRVRFNNILTMSRKNRAVVEKVIRDYNGFKFSPKHGLNKSKLPEQYKKLMMMLEKLGFPHPFVEEALEYTSTLSSALAWLLIHVPEEDVPKTFMPSDIGFTARISSNMTIESTISKLQSFGYSEDVARITAEANEGSLKSSLLELTRSFVEYKELQDDLPEIWSEELESLSVMLDGNQLQVDNDNGSCTISSEVNGIKISFFKPPRYPHSIPGIGITPIAPGNITKVVQLEATRRAAKYAQENLLGDFMIMTLFQHMEETFGDILKSPVKLAQISSGIFGVDESKLLEKEKEELSKKKDESHTKKRKVLSFEQQKVLSARESRMSTEPGKEMLGARKKLPAWNKSKEIVDLVQKHQVVLLTGETGSGKSTQAVQFILDANPTSQIICTQPRRISAIGVAQRVADERLVQIGDQVGYIIRGESKTSDKTQIKFVTSGVLLRMLQGNIALENEQQNISGMDGITHIVVDEVHERSLDGDFLLILLKKLIQKAPKIKIILMSATVDPKQFFDYFSPLDVGYTHIPGRTFPVKQYFLDDVLKETGYRPKKSSKDDDNEYDDSSSSKSDSIGKIIGEIRANSPGRVDYNLIGAAVEYIHKKLNDAGDSAGSILIFLSGAAEIDQALRAVSNTTVGGSLWTLPLHAALPPSDQRKVFQKAPRGQRKVIASTNVAETSITISDIVAVVDTGRVKETVFDPEANITRLVDTWISQASATQRMGRAGRVRSGECFKLYTENAQSSRMPSQPVPEILRSPLEVLYLNVKSMGVSNVEKFLSKAIDPPKSTALDTAKQNLIAYGALDPLENELTSLGRHISMIPTDPRTAKLLVLGAMMGCLSTCLTVAAFLSVGKLPFILPRNDEQAKKNLEEKFTGENGDLLAACHAYSQYCQGDVDKRLVSANVCRDVKSARRQLLSSLIQVGFVNTSTLQGGKENLPEDLTRYDNDHATVRSLIASSLQPNIVEIVFPQQKYMSTSAGAIQKDGVDDSRQIKFFNTNGERVFVHPRSVLFGATSFVGSSRYMSYGGAIMTSKHFISDLTPLPNFGLILFASRIGVDPLGNGLIVDKWTGLKCWPRAGILLQFLQKLFGSLMDEKLKNPGVNIIGHPVIQLVHDLIESESKPQGVGLVA